MGQQESHHEQVKRAGGNDVADWGEKVTKGAYAPGTTFTINGMVFDPGRADEILAAGNADARVQRLEAIATRLHAGQVDGQGVAYIEHLRAVAAGVSACAKAVALFHDAAEDQGCTRDDLIEFGLSLTEADAVQLLTRTDGMTYADYVERTRPLPDPPATWRAR